MFLKIFAIFNINPHKIFLKVIENISPCSHVCWRLLHSTPRPQQVPHVGDTGLVTTDRQYRHSFHHLLLLDNLLTTSPLSLNAALLHVSLGRKHTLVCPLHPALAGAGHQPLHWSWLQNSFQSRGQVGAPIFGSWCCPRR